MYLMILYLSVGTYLSLPIAYWANETKNMGYWWALFFSVTLTPVGCYMLARLSGDKSDEIVMPFLTQLIILTASFLVHGIALVMILAGVHKENEWGWLLVLAGMGLAGAGIFGAQLVFSSRATDDDYGMR